MPARTGKQYIDGLRERPPNLYMSGKQVKDPTTQPGLMGGIGTLARLYDLQHDRVKGKEMTYESPTTGDQVGMSFLTPRTREDLDRRRQMMTNWARITCGMMGRTPDFLNVSLMSMAAAGRYFGQNRPEFEKHIQDYYESVREKDLVLTHTLVNIQRNRSGGATALDDSLDVALSVVKETDAGIVVNGARVLATLPIADEIAVYPARSHRLPTGAPGRTSFAFAIPCDTPGLKFQCREPFDLQRSSFDHPLGSRFEEMDALAFFDNVLVPWERVFLYGDVDMCNEMSLRTHQFLHSGHQVVTKNVVKCEFVLGLANLMVKTLGSSEQPQVHGLMSEIIENLEITKALLRAAEVDAELDEWGVMCPQDMPLMVARQSFIRMYPRMGEILHLLGSSSLMALPTEDDFVGPLADDISRYLETDFASARDRVRLFRLAWDTCCSAFGSRQILYERFFQGDRNRNVVLMNSRYDKEPMSRWVQEFLDQD
ncbi:MAG: 4-hydroxyphenylacetate 3-monooxygenase, oxygenase component [Chloroflexi bacterium]|nr:4-hydroxyphenylacetate 3-monooxygenase, oxygenase component [Chloroflexota bacterium]MDA1270681.1 4-hydroxyphenylacetate 3-monooxygenase, oxygenase component [Chloroflexota bacterium]